MDLLNEIPKCCSSCEHLYNEVVDEPCCNCFNNDKWQPNDYLKYLSKIKKENKKHG
jgi:hypothetical protein